MSPRSGGGFASALPGPEHRASPPGLPDFIAEVRDALDASGVLTDPVDREAYATPWRGTPGRTPVVVRPATTAAVAEVVRLASRHRVRLIPQGANSGLVEASVPDRYGHMVVLSFERLRSRLEVDVDDRTVIADAGVRLSTLNEALAPHGLSLPIDLGSDPSLGGMVSTNTGGARMIHHGDLRRHLLGPEVVLAEPPGAVLDDLGALRKNNTSPKVSDWFIGAAGRFGIVTAVALEVAAIDRDRATAFLVPADDRAAVTITAALERALGHRLRAVEAMDAQALGLAAGEPGVHNPFGEDAPPPLTLLVEAAETDPAPDRSAEEALVRALAELPGSVLLDALVVPPGDAWGLRHRVSEALARSGTVMGFDLSVRRSRLPELRAALDNDVRPYLPDGASLVEFGHWGDGGLHANLVVPHAATGGRPPHPETIAGLRRRIWAVVAGLGGSWASEHGWGPTNDDALAAHGDPVRIDLLDRIEAMLDPQGILGRPRHP